MSKVLVCGAGGFIGHHLVKKLKSLGCNVTGVDIKMPEFEKTEANHFLLRDLADPKQVQDVFYSELKFDEVYQLAASMGGAGFIFVGKHDADIMRNNILVNVNVCDVASRYSCDKILYTSSACVYPGHIQTESNNPGLRESMAYPANPDSEYGWEKLFSERLYTAYKATKGLNIRIARLHNVFGELGTWTGGKEKAPAAIMRKVCEAGDNGEIEIWGSGSQTRSFLYINDCINGLMSLMESDFQEPVNIGSEEQISIDGMADIAIELSGKVIRKKHIPGPVGVEGRNSQNDLVKSKVRWEPKISLREGMGLTFPWINKMVKDK